MKTSVLRHLMEWAEKLRDQNVDPSLQKLENRLHNGLTCTSYGAVHRQVNQPLEQNIRHWLKHPIHTLVEGQIYQHVIMAIHNQTGKESKL